MAQKFLLFLIAIYSYTLSPLISFIGIRCRFYPSCSSYAKICFLQFSFPVALWYSMKRFFKCNPLFIGGVDFPPCEKSVVPIKDCHNNH